MRLRGTVFLAAVLMAASFLQGCSQSKASYRFGATRDLLDDSFYAGQAEDGSQVAGRQAFIGRTSHDGKRVAFWAMNSDTFGSGFFIADVGDPGSYRRITFDYLQLPLPSAPIHWTPDDSALLVGGYRVQIPPVGFRSDLEPLVIHGIPTNDSSVTSLPTGNWAISVARQITGDNIVALPILADGSEDPAREPVYLTDFKGFTPSADWPCVSPDGTRIVFADYQGATEGSAAPDAGNIYVLKNVQAILAAPQKPGTRISSLAPTGAIDSNLVPIRVEESANFAHTASFSQDGSLVFFSEDYNNVFSTQSFLYSLLCGDFDVMISNADGSGEDFRLKQAGTQAFASTTSGGPRVVYNSFEDDGMHLLMSAIEVVTPVKGTSLPNNDVATTALLKAVDGGGTIVSVPTDTTVDFPEGVPQEIVMSTPVDPVQPQQLSGNIAAIPVVRDFGPDGTQFSKAINITIAYTDAEIRGLDEAGLRVLRFNPASGAFDEEVTSGVVRDLVNNRITFSAQVLSTYGLGASPSS